MKLGNKRPKQDPLGVVSGIAVFVLLVAGYLGSTLAMQRAKTATSRRRVLSLIAYSIITALVFGVIIGAYPDIGSNFWPLWGEFALMCLAVALFAATLQSLIGPIGTLVTVVVMVFFGNPSTGGVNGTAYLPAFSQAIGPVLPPWNGTTLVRNTLYFEGNAITQPLIVLSVYVVVGAALVTVLTYGRLLWVARRENATPPDQRRGRRRRRHHPTCLRPGFATPSQPPRHARRRTCPSETAYLSRRPGEYRALRMTLPGTWCLGVDAGPAGGVRERPGPAVVAGCGDGPFEPEQGGWRIRIRLSGCRRRPRLRCCAGTARSGLRPSSGGA